MGAQLKLKVNGGWLPVRKQNIRNGVFPPEARKPNFPEAPDGLSTEKLTKWMRDAAAAVDAARDAERERWIRTRKTDTFIRIEFMAWAWEGRDIGGGEVVSIDGAEIDKLDRLHLPDGRVIKGHRVELSDTRILANKAILDTVSDTVQAKPKGKQKSGGKKHTFTGEDKWCLSSIINEVIRGNRKAGIEPLEGASAKAEIERRIKADPVLKTRVPPSSRMLDNWIEDVKSTGEIRGSVPIKQPRTDILR